MLHVYIFVPNRVSLSTHLSIDVAFHVKFILVTGTNLLLQCVNNTKSTLTL